MRTLLVVFALLFPVLAAAQQEPSNALVWACFVPGQDCEGRIAAEIDQAKTSIHLQAYGLTSTRILQALRAAIERGVSVDAILDETNEQTRYGAARYLLLAGAHVWIDDKVTIAHNKVIVIDDILTVGGSFNFTKSAQKRNAENVTFTQSQQVAGWFLDNWRARLAVSRPYDVSFRRPQ